MLHSSRFRPCFSLRATLPAINSTRLGWQTFVSSFLVPPDKLLTSGNYHAILLHGRQSLSSSHLERLFWAFGPLRTNAACANSFRICTYKNGAAISFRISTYEKRGRGWGGRFCPARYCPSVSEPVEPVASRHFLAASSSEKAPASFTDPCEVGPPFGSRVTTQWSPFCHPRNLPTRLDILMGRDSFPSGAWGVYSGSREAHSCNFLVRGF